MIRGTFPTLRRRAAQARHTQLHMLAGLQAFDAAVQTHMAHGAMTGADPLTDSVLQQLDCAAEEGGQPAIPYPDGQQPQPEHRGWWLAAATLLAALASACLLMPRA